MRLLRRNTTEFSYRAYTGKMESLTSTGLRTGNYVPLYAEPVTYRGNISVPSGSATSQFFGLDTKYTHVLLMDTPNVDINEYGLIDWNGNTYEITAVRPSLNVLAIALKQRTKNNAANGSG